MTSGQSHFPESTPRGLLNVGGPVLDFGGQPQTIMGHPVFVDMPNGPRYVQVRDDGLYGSDSTDYDSFTKIEVVDLPINATGISGCSVAESLNMAGPQGVR